MIPILVSISGGTRIRASVAALAAVFLSAALAQQQQLTAPATESRVAVDNTSLYVRVAGRGQPMIVLHGGPDFDTAYLLPELDQLTDAYRLIYYDQRGRGKSADGVRAEDVTLASDLADLEAIRARSRWMLPCCSATRGAPFWHSSTRCGTRRVCRG